MHHIICRPKNLIWTSGLFIGFIFLFIKTPLTCYGANPFDPPKEESLVLCVSSRVLSLDPTNHRDRDTQMVIKNIFDSLTTRDRHLQVVPQMAESWEIIDPITWEFKLKKGITFHNGDSFTAEDVKFTLDRVTKEGAIDGKTSPRKTLLGQIAKVEVIDQFTVRIITFKPWPILPLMLTLQEIVPNRYMQRIGTRQFEKAPAGTGPFKFMQKKDGTLILKRFEDYYGGSHKNPPVQVAPLKHLVFKTVSDQALRTAMLKKGRADIVTNIPLETIPIFDVLPDIEIISQPATRSYFADLNCMKPPFNNQRARVAVNYAMDMRMIVNTMFQGKGQILPTILLKQAFAFNDRLMPYPYDPENTRQIFQQLNFPREYTIKIVCIEQYAKFANAISSFLSKVGVKSAITIGEKTVVRAAMKKLEADILVTSWGNTTLDPVGILLPKLKSDGRGNFSNYSNEKVDQLFLLAESALSPGKRADYYKQIQEIIHKESPMIFGYATEEFYGVRKRVKGFSPSATGMLNLHDVYVEETGVDKK
jgi:peptide/nickel transport system substrate-binding protein